MSFIDDIANCPCGGKARVTDDEWGVMVECADCGLNNGGEFSPKRGVSESVAHWNGLFGGKGQNSKKVKAFDFMISTGNYEYHCDPDYISPGKENYQSVRKLSGQVNYKGRIFVVLHRRGRLGSGGMDDGRSGSVDIIMIKA